MVEEKQVSKSSEVGVYLSTPGINLPLTYGTIIGPVFGDILLRKMESVRTAAKGNILLNCHTPFFTDQPREETVSSLAEQRNKEYSSLRITKGWIFERDDLLHDAMGNSVNELFRKDILFSKDGAPFVNINKLKSLAQERENDVVLVPNYYKKEFHDYLRTKEDSIPCTGKLNYGYKMSSFGFGENTFLSQIWEQILFSTFTDQRKIIISGPNVLGPYTFKAAMTNLVLNDGKINIAVHSLSRLKGDFTLQKHREGQVGLATIAVDHPQIDNTSYLRFMASEMISNSKVRLLDESIGTMAKKTILKYQNLEKVLGKTDINDERNLSIEDVINSVYGIADRLFKGLQKVSKDLSGQRVNLAEWTDLSRDLRFVTGGS